MKYRSFCFVFFAIATLACAPHASSAADAAKPPRPNVLFLFADEAIRFLREHKDGPFFCYVPFAAPHDPHIVSDDYPVRYDADKIPLPPNFLPQHPFDNGEMNIRDENLLSHPRKPGDVTRQPFML